MTRGLAISASGLLHAQRRLEASAHNTANLTTERTTVLRVTGREARDSNGVTSETSADSSIRFGDRRSAPFVEEAVVQMAAVNHAGALRRAVQTQDDMLGVLLDMVA